MSKEMNYSIKDMLNALENDDDFKILKEKYEAPNAFSIMVGNRRREEWHSSFVSWLLDPKQNHKLETFPLERFLELVESKSENLKFDKNDIDDMVFETEYSIEGNRRIDIYGKSRSLGLVIENKIDANENIDSENEAQSEAYYKYFENNKSDDIQNCYVLLKVKPRTHLENKHFIEITYQELFDKVIKKACEYCEELGLEDTKRVLEQYAIAISNPFAGKILAKTQKDIANKIYEKHKFIIEKMRITMGNPNRDKKDDICKVYKKNEKYINNVILHCAGKSLIEEKKNGRTDGSAVVNLLLEAGYIIKNETKLVYKRMFSICVIWIDENNVFHAGYYRGKERYNGSQKINELPKLFKSLREAQMEVEEKVGYKNKNSGKSPFEIKLINPGKELKPEEKTIRDIKIIKDILE